MTLPQLPQDKANHWVYGSLIYLTFFTLFSFLSLPLIEFLSLGVVITFAVAKELADWMINERLVEDNKQPTHGVEFLDALATIAGGSVPFVAINLKNYF